MKSIVTALAVGAVLATSSAASADTDWKHSSDFQHAKTASIRIVEPEGYKVSVGEQNDTVPAVFKFSNENNYHKVTVTAPDGKTWSKKIEVRAYKETVLRVSYAPKGKTAPAKGDKKVRSFIGNVKNKCGRVFLRFEFMLDGEKKHAESLNPRQNKDLTLQSGAYEVRIFNATKKRPKWKFIRTDKATISADGWKFAPSCN